MAALATAQFPDLDHIQFIRWGQSRHSCLAPQVSNQGEESADHPMILKRVTEFSKFVI